jgi:hypothetical protein
MDIAIIIAKLTKALVDLAVSAVQAYIEGDPSKLDKVQSVLEPHQKLKSEEMLELEREKTRKALEEDVTP